MIAAGLAPGSHTSTLTYMSQGYQLVEITCDDDHSSSPSSGNLSSATIGDGTGNPEKSNDFGLLEQFIRTSTMGPGLKLDVTAQQAGLKK